MPWSSASTIGKRVVPSVEGAGGVWRLGEVEESRRDGVWPVSVPVPSTNLVAWYSAALGVYDATTGGSAVSSGSTVARWDDSSGSGFHLTQATEAARPTLTNNAVNGHPAITFAGGDVLSTAAAIVTGATLRTIFVVCSGATSATNRIAMLGDESSSGALFAITGELAVRVSSGSRIWASSLSATHVLLTVRLTTGNVSGAEARLNGSDLSVSSTEARALNTQSGLEVGGSLGGDIAEMLIYDAALSTTDRDSVELYLTNKYGL